MTSSGRAPAGWYPDPARRHQHRFWDGARWTLQVADDGVAGIDARAQQPTAGQQRTEQADVEQTTEQQPALRWTTTEQAAVEQTTEQQPALQWVADPSAMPPAVVAQPDVAVAPPDPPPAPPRAAAPPLNWSTDVATPAPAARASRKRTGLLVAAVVVAVLAIGVTGMVAFAAGDSEGAHVDAADRYPAAIEANFVRGCTTAGATADYCRCALDHIEQTYTLAAFEDAERTTLAGGRTPEGMLNAVRDCVSELEPDTSARDALARAAS